MVKQHRRQMAVTLWLAVTFVSSAQSASFVMELNADGDSRWYDLFSAAWVELGQPWNGSPTLDGFYGIQSEPGFGGSNYSSNTFDPLTFTPTVYAELGGGVDAFPNAPAFTSGNYSVDYDDSGVTGIGTEVAPITSFSVNFSDDIVIDVLGAASDIWTTSNPSGSVTLVNGTVTAIEGGADVATTYDLSLIGAGIVDYEGTFTVDSGAWDLYVDGPPMGHPGRAARMVWDAQGSVSNLPVGVDGDLNDDGNYDCLDVDALVAEIVASTNDALFDLTGDGSVDGSDLEAWLAEAGAVNLPSGNPYLPGDATLDGNVDGQDFVDWNSNKFTSTAAWCGGDFNADGAVDGQDFVIWNSNKFQSSDGFVTVPEPTARGFVVGLLLVSGFILRPNRVS
ncbi:MAG: hypothetical protein AAGF97_06855 [Planctomycetota bacterium]